MVFFSRFMLTEYAAGICNLCFSQGSHFITWVNHFGHSVSWGAASPANHPIKEGVVACSFQAKGTDLHLTTYSTHSPLSSNWFVLEPCSCYYLPFANGCVICGFNIQTIWIFFQFIGKDTKKPNRANSV